MSAFKYPPHTFTDTRTGKLVKSSPLMEKVSEGKTIQLWLYEWEDGWYIEVDGKEFTNYQQSQDYDALVEIFDDL